MRLKFLVEQIAAAIDTEPCLNVLVRVIINLKVLSTVFSATKYFLPHVLRYFPVALGIGAFCYFLEFRLFFLLNHYVY
jgi:hypothetical protein